LGNQHSARADARSLRSLIHTVREFDPTLLPEALLRPQIGIEWRVVRVSGPTRITFTSKRTMCWRSFTSSDCARALESRWYATLERVAQLDRRLDRMDSNAFWGPEIDREGLLAQTGA
jgi:hypothetical protein